MKLSTQQIDDFNRDGVVCLRGVFDTEWIENLSVGVEKNFKDPGPYHTVYTDKDNPGGFYDDYCNWSRIEEYNDFVKIIPGRRNCSAIDQVQHSTHLS